MKMANKTNTQDMLICMRRSFATLEVVGRIDPLGNVYRQYLQAVNMGDLCSRHPTVAYVDQELPVGSCCV